MSLRSLDFDLDRKDIEQPTKAIGSQVVFPLGRTQLLVCGLASIGRRDECRIGLPELFNGDR